MGRPSKDLAQKILSGTAQKCRIAVGLDGRPVGDVKPPVDFTEDQMHYWDELFDIFNEAGAITDADIPALNLLAMTYTRARTDPKMSINEIRGVMAMLAKFGGVPSDRKHVTPIRKKEKSELDKLRARRQDEAGSKT